MLRRVLEKGRKLMDVEWFDIKVKNPLAVDKLDSSDNLSNKDLALSLREAIVVRGSPRDEIPASEVFRHKHRVEWTLVELNQLDYEGRLYQGIEHGHLSPDLPNLLLLVLRCCKFTC